MKFIYMGTSDFAVPALKALCEAGHEAAVCVTQCDKPSSRRGNAVVFSPVKQAASEMGIEVYQPQKVSSPESCEHLASFNADVIVVASYGQLLRENILKLTPCGAINLHASLLPRHRGACPIERAIMCGDENSGVTVMYMDKGLDTGDVMLKRSVPITDETTGDSLKAELSRLAAETAVEALRFLDEGEAPRAPQDSYLFTYAEKITKEERFVDFSRGADEIERKIRAFSTAYCAQAYCNGKLVKLIFAARSDEKRPEDASDGEIIRADKKGIIVAAGNGCVRITRVKPEGKGEMDTYAFYNGLKGDKVFTHML